MVSLLKIVLVAFITPQEQKKTLLQSRHFKTWLGILQKIDGIFTTAKLPNLISMFAERIIKLN